MNEEEYLALADLIGRHLVELGLGEIADLGNYMDNEGEERSPPDGRALIKLMLGAFDRYLAVNSAETVEESLEIIRGCIDEGERPGGVFVHLGEEELAVTVGRDGAEPIATLGNMSETRTALRRLAERLLEDSGPPEPDGESRGFG